MTSLRWGERTYVMGIINLTADSFSGDGLAPTGRSEAEILAAALAQTRTYVEAGADIVDVGAESSRPAQFYGKHPEMDAEAEAAVAVPVVVALARGFGRRALVSIDTTKGDVARAALAAGAAMINDVWAARRDPRTAHAAAEANAYLVLMHNQEVAEYPHGLFETVVGSLRIGFGKTPAHSVEILHRLAELKAALGGLPLLVGTSRKRFIGELLGGAPPRERLEGTAATVALAIAAGADIVRVHDVAAIMKTVRVTDAIVRWQS